MKHGRENLKIFLPGTQYPAGHAKPKTDKAGLLLVAFGTSVPQARTAFDRIEARVREAFSDMEVRRAYTSPTIRKILASRGESRDSTVTALARMMEDGFTHVAVGSLHTVRGKEYEDLVETVRAFLAIPKGFRKAVVGAPLLSSRRDLERVAAAMIENLPPQRKPHEAVLFMGHGTLHPANAYYDALMRHVRALDDLVFVSTVDGSPTIEDLAAELREQGIAKAYLFPFMSVAGEHARTDMAGDRPESWKSVLLKMGIACDPVLQGTAEYENLVDVWVDHLKDAVEALFAPDCVYPWLQSGRT